MVDKDEALKMVDKQPEKPIRMESQSEEDSISFTALRDHRIVCNQEDYALEKGKSYKIPKKWEPTLKSEGVI